MTSKLPYATVPCIQLTARFDFVHGIIAPQKRRQKRWSRPSRRTLLPLYCRLVHFINRRTKPPLPGFSVAACFFDKHYGGVSAIVWSSRRHFRIFLSLSIPSQTFINFFPGCAAQGCQQPVTAQFVCASDWPALISFLSFPLHLHIVCFHVGRMVNEKFEAERIL